MGFRGFSFGFLSQNALELQLTWTSQSYSPGGGSHDAASTIGGDSAAAAPLRRVVVHSEIVPELVGQRDCGSQRVVRMVLPVDKSAVLTLSFPAVKMLTRLW